MLSGFIQNVTMSNARKPLRSAVRDEAKPSFFIRPHDYTKQSKNCKEPS